MSLFQKRLLILFSVALNIGFVVVAIVMMINHATHSRHHSDHEILDVVRQLNLPQSQESAVMKTIQDFRAVVDQNKQALKQARIDVVRCLAQDGPVDRNRLHRLTQNIGTVEDDRNNAFESHFLELRNQLGDKKGAHFFALLMALHEPEESKANP